jgi:V/A-type H+-transporting ATPase subunit I
MKFLTLSGPKDDIDRIADKYLSKYEIQLENTLSELKDVHKLRPFTGANPYKDTYNKSLEYVRLLGDVPAHEAADISIDEAVSIIDTIDSQYSVILDQKKELNQEIEELLRESELLLPFRKLEYDLNTILNFKYIRFSFGRMPADQYEKFQKFIYDDLDVLFIKCEEQDGFVWGVYFAPREQYSKISAIFSSLHFAKTYIPDDCAGTPNDVYLELQDTIKDHKKQLESLDLSFNETLASNKEKLLCANARLEKSSYNYDLRKLAAIESKESEERFILCGWISDKDCAVLAKELEQEPEVYCIVNDNNDSTLSTPPTKLKNPAIFRPFEMFVRMYGLPAYNEMDPTLFIALTYSFIFGVMFGDVGQGLCLCIGGFLLYRFKKMNLAAIVSCCGIFSTIFGFMFGSFFGFEDILQPLWLRPGIKMSTLPFIGRMNTILVVTIAFGMGVILFSMVLHIINAIKAHQISDALFDANGAAGLVFYASLTLVIVLFMTGRTLPASILLVVMFGVPLLLIACKEPITNMLLHKKELIEGGPVMFVVQTFFELFEVLLSYLSNTISFVRVGAFAISHAAMMEVVLMLAGAESGNTSWPVIVLGNIFVCCLEGLIVGIQVLRLEYYEMFSRFYKGTGREFKPYKVK